MEMNFKTAEFLDYSLSLRELLFIAIALACLLPIVSAPMALLMGVIVAQLLGQPFAHLNHKVTHFLLQWSVVGLGFGVDMHTAVGAGKVGFAFSLGSILFTLTIGLLIGKMLNIDKKTSILISVGTAICGGSAIAAMSPVIRAQEKQISIALGTIFVLNAVALFIFPLIGSWFGLSQGQFGIWAAIAIHDTSSVVGAAGKYGTEALKVATTVKLTRALWIMPITLLGAVMFRTKASAIKFPYFIGCFIIVVVLRTCVPVVGTIGGSVTHVAGLGLTLALFLIGSGLSRQVLQSLGVRPVFQGIFVWVLISILSLWIVIRFL